MSNSLAEELFQQLQGAPLQQLSQQLGTGQAETSNAIGTALPLLLGALGRNAAQPSGADALLGALQNDHNSGLDLGSVLGSVLGGTPTRQTNGAAILGHIFGVNQERAAAGLGQATGLGNDKAAVLMQVLAPIVMSFLARRFLGGQQGGASPAVLGQVLGEERQAAHRSGVGGGLLGAVFDQDGDGQLGLGDLLRIGGGLLGDKR